MLHARQKWKLSGDQSSRQRRSKCSALDINENPPRGDQNSSRWCLKQSTLSINEKTPWGKSNSGAHSKNLGTEFKTSRQRNLKCSTPGVENQNSSRRRNSKCSALGINKKSLWWKGDSKNLCTEFRQQNSKGSEFKILHAKFKSLSSEFKSLLNRSEIHYKHIYLEKLGGKGETIFT